MSHSYDLLTAKPHGSHGVDMNGLRMHVWGLGLFHTLKTLLLVYCKEIKQWKFQWKAMEVD